MALKVCRTINTIFTRKAFPSLYQNRSFGSTIFAKSSGQGKCGVSVIRVSGCDAKLAVNTLTQSENIPLKHERKAIVKKLYDPGTGEVLDNALVLWFTGPRSFTGEDSCEFHVHGGPAVISAVLGALSKVPGLSHAKAGEFTRRAFHNNKLGLTEVEGLADLIHSETEAQRKQAIRTMDGTLAQLFSQWRHRLIKCVANIGAWIDFGEDENIEADTMNLVVKELKDILGEIERHLKDQRRGERLRSGVHAVIVGKPNVGKSSLLNLICQRQVSIVSPIPGTTRDVIETAYDIGGYPVLFSDTAGLRLDSGDIIEAEGVRRAKAKVNQADLVIMMVDAVEFSEKCSPVLNKVADQFAEFDLPNWIPEALIDRESSPAGSDILFIANKMDLAANNVDLVSNFPPDTIYLSCKSEDGVEAVVKGLQKSVQKLCGNPLIETGSLLRERHIAHLSNCKNFIIECLDLLDIDIVIASRKIHVALHEIARITGEVRTDDILDVIFQDFCIGK